MKMSGNFNIRLQIRESLREFIEFGEIVREFMNHNISLQVK